MNLRLNFKLRNFLVFFLILGIIFFIISHENIENTSWFEISKTQQKFFISSLKNSFLQRIKFNENLNQDFPQSKVNYCLNGKDKNSMNKREILNEFIESPCSPLITVPGILGTLLSVQIDCKTLQSKNQELFKNCGWSTCSWSFLKENLIQNMFYGFQK